MQKKPVFIALSYFFLVYYLFDQGKPIVFTVLFSFFIELVLILFLYLIFAIRSGNKKFIKRAKRVLSASIPLLLINYIIALNVSVYFNEFPVSDNFNDRNFFEPILYFKNIILIIIFNLFLAYSFDIIGFIKKKEAFEKVEQGVIYQGIFIWVMSFVGFFSMIYIGDKGKMYVLLILIFTRLLMEYFFKNKENKFESQTKKNS